MKKEFFWIHSDKQKKSVSLDKSFLIKCKQNWIKFSEHEQNEVKRVNNDEFHYRSYLNHVTWELFI